MLYAFDLKDWAIDICFPLTLFCALVVILSLRFLMEGNEFPDEIFELLSV